MIWDEVSIDKDCRVAFQGDENILKLNLILTALT